MEWLPIDSAPEGVAVETKIDDNCGCRNEQMLTRQGNLWFLPDMSMYVYYAPTHWKPLARQKATSGLAVAEQNKKESQ